MKAKHVGFTVEVLQDQGMGSARTVTKIYVTVSTYGLSHNPQIDLGPRNITICWLQGAWT